MTNFNDQSSTQTPNRRRRRLRKALKVVASLLVLYTLSGIVFDLLVWAEIRKIKREGDPVTLAQLIPPMPPDSQNGAIVYQKAFRLMHSHKFDALHSLILQKRGDENAAAWTAAKAQCSDFVPVAELAREAASRPRCVFEADWKGDCFPANPKVIRLATLLCAYAMILSSDGDSDAAIGALGVAVQVIDDLENQHGYIPFLIRNKIYETAADTAYAVALSNGVDTNKAQALSDSLAWDSFEAEMPVVLKNERATYNSLFDEIAKSGSLHWEGYGRDEVNAWRRFEYSLVGRPVLRADQLRYLHAARRVMSRSEVPFRKLPAPKPSGQPCSCQSGSLLLSDELQTDIYSWRRNADSDKARINGTRVAIAICVYKNQFGKYPQSLSDLSDLHWKLDLQDPFSGRDFIYKPQANGFLLYSLGPDLKDNGGKPDKERPIPQQGYDLVWMKH